MEKKSGGVTISKRTLAILLIIIVLLVAGGVILGMNWDRWFGDGAETTEAFTPELDPDASDWDGSDLTNVSGDETESVGIQIPGYPSITIPADEETVSVALLNPEGNPCYFTFTLVLKDTDEVLYTSGMVAPGQAITSITMSRALEAGEYDAVIQITTASLEDGSAMNGANVETVLIVQ
ncbi:MAG: hypothetical protein LUD12_12530 [Lachnospiraceae bacterium]|nr:hypothetical protein [Lachnospiraceae bacterium]